MGLLDRGQAVLVSRQKTAAGRTVTYRRKSDGQTLTLTAWPGDSAYARTTEGPGASRISGEFNYLVEVADLVIDGAAFTPAKGDRVTDTINGTAITFELYSPAQDEPVWRYANNFRFAIRLHCKRA